MARVWFLLGLMVVILTVYTVVDCAMFDRSRVRGLPRWVWIFVILFIPVIGPLLWLIVGRGRRQVAGGTRPTRSMAPDDDPDFLRGLAAQATQEQRIRQMEQELADLDKPDSTDGGTPKGGTPKGGTPQGGAGSGGPNGSAGGSGATGAPGAAGIPPKTTDPGDGEQPGRREA